MQCVELFTGCGGLAMGLSRAGFKALRMSEWDKHSILNVNHNKDNGIAFVKDWPIHHEDVRSVDWAQFKRVDIVAGGPPCQPFSIGGLHRGHHDGRDMWPEAVRAVREIQPIGFLFENVRGLTRAAFSDYLEWVRLSLSLPEIAQGKRESRAGHLTRLRKATRATGQQYNVKIYQANAADFGAAQKRHRVFILGLRQGMGDLPGLEPTHSRESLLWDQWISGEYWRRHNRRVPVTGPNSVDITTIERLKASKAKPVLLPWRSVRDALVGLDEPGKRSKVANHVLQPGARAYAGHTGSPIDMPAKALKAGVHGVPGGENMMALPNGEVRYFTVREAARLQGVPDEFEFIGSWSENMRQCGNAVPVPLAQHVATKMRSAIERSNVKGRAAA